MAIGRSESKMSEKQNFRNISIVGGGAWGTALAEVMSRQGHQINLWAKESSVVNSINSKHENDVFLPNIKLSNLIVAFNNLEQITKCDLLLVVSPAQHTRETLVEVSKTLKSETPIILCSKGIEISTLSLMSQITESIFSLLNHLRLKLLAYLPHFLQLNSLLP